MSGFSETAYLVNIVIEQDEIGQQVGKTTKRLIYVNPFSVTATAFYAAAQAGMKPSCDLQIRTCDYNGEKRIDYAGAAHAITRIVKNPEFTRLICEQVVSYE